MNEPLASAGGEYMAARLNPFDVTSTGRPTCTSLRMIHGTTTRPTTAAKPAARRQPTVTTNHTASTSTRYWADGRVSTSRPVSTADASQRRSTVVDSTATRSSNEIG